MAAKPEPAKNGAEAAAAPAAAAGGGGAKAWLPLMLNIVLMPVLAYGITNFLLIPKLKSAVGKTEAHGEAESGGKGESEHGSEKGEKPKAEASGHGESKKEGGGGKAKSLAPLSGKVLVNLAGTLGTRYLLANITLVGNSSDFKGMVEKNDSQLRDVAASTLSSKTIPDLEKPGARNLIRTELISVFNSVLGNGTVADIYLTEFAIQ